MAINKKPIAKPIEPARNAPFESESITAHHASAMAGGRGDTATIQLGFADGSIGTVHYLANGSKAFPKERLEVFQAGRVLQLDNFRKLTGYGVNAGRGIGLFRQDKGQEHCAKAFVDAIRTGQPSPIAFDELIEVARITVALAEAA